MYPHRILARTTPTGMTPDVLRMYLHEILGRTTPSNMTSAVVSVYLFRILGGLTPLLKYPYIEKLAGLSHSNVFSMRLHRILGRTAPPEMTPGDPTWNTWWDYAT